MFYVFLSIEPKLSKKQDEGHGKKVTILKEKLEAHNHEAKNWWNTFFIISCAFAVFNDPVFCYMNAIDYKHKCITADWKLARRYIYCRTATDVFYLFDVIISKCGCGCCCCCCREGGDIVLDHVWHALVTCYQLYLASTFLFPLHRYVHSMAAWDAFNSFYEYLYFYSFNLFLGWLIISLYNVFRYS